MEFENDLHDWYVDGVMLAPSAGGMLTPSEVTLSVHLYEARKRIRLSGVTRCLLDNFSIQNIIYEAKVIATGREPGFHKEGIDKLNKVYPIKTAPSSARILSIVASVGMEGVIEFRDIDVIDV